MRSRSLANFVGIVVSFLNVLLIRLRSLLLAEADPLTGGATKGSAIKIKFLPYREVTPCRRHLPIEMVFVLLQSRPVLLILNFRLIHYKS
jgi:hypothetical protein